MKTFSVTCGGYIRVHVFPRQSFRKIESFIATQSKLIRNFETIICLHGSLIYTFKGKTSLLPFVQRSILQKDLRSKKHTLALRK